MEASRAAKEAQALNEAKAAMVAALDGRDRAIISLAGDMLLFEDTAAIFEDKKPWVVRTSSLPALGSNTPDVRESI